MAGDQTIFPFVLQLENFCIGSLYLPVASWIGYRGETHLDTHFFTEVEEDSTGELNAVVGDDLVWNSEAVDDPLDELDGGLGRLAWYWHHLYPFCELVDGHE